MEKNTRDDDSDQEILEEINMRQKTPFTNNIVSHSILTVLQDKNRFISILKQQIQNQKLQLQFYLHRGLGGPRITNMSEKCVLVEAEENLQVNLALNKFCKQNGIKSKIMSLHDRMVNVEKRILRVAKEQEEICKGADVRGDSKEVGVLSKILESSDILRAELEAFRTCCNRLILVEDERNCLVEQVYSVPTTQRMNYSALLVALHEKTRLEKEVGEIKKEQKALLQRLEGMKPRFQEQDRVQLTQCIKQLKEVNCLLAAKITTLEQDVQCKEIIENKMERVIDEYQKFREQSSEQLTELHNKLGDVIDENETLRNSLEHYHEIDEQVKSLHSRIDEMEKIRKERDYFKARDEDLQVIRAAYLQLTEQPCQPHRDQDETRNNQEQQITMLEQQNSDNLQEIADLSFILSEKEKQIKELVMVVDNFVQFRKKQVPTHNVRINTHVRTYRDFGCNSADFNFPKRICTANTEQTNSGNSPKTLPNDSDSELFKLNGMNLKANKHRNVQSNAPVTSLKIHTANSNGIAESLKAIVESASPVDAIIQLNNSSAFTLRLTCGSHIECITGPNLSQNTVPLVANKENFIRVNHRTNLTNNIKCSTIVMDEFELMKDSSNEGFVTLPSIHHTVQTIEQEEIEVCVHQEGDDEDVVHQLVQKQSFGCVFSNKTIEEDSVSNCSIDDLLFEEPEEDKSSNSGDGSILERLKKIVVRSGADQMFESLFAPQVPTL